MREECYSGSQNVPGTSADHSFMQRPAHPLFEQVKPFMDIYKWMGKKNEGANKCLQNKKIRYCQLCLKMSVNGVFVVN